MYQVSGAMNGSKLYHLHSELYIKVTHIDDVVSKGQLEHPVQLHV